MEASEGKDACERSVEVTQYLQQAKKGDSSALDQLLPLIYDELRVAAGRAMRGRRRDQTLQPTALVHEAYMRLFGGESAEWENRRHFFSVATMAMRQLLTDYARAKDAEKRGGDLHRVELNSGIEQRGPLEEVNLPALDSALNKLEKLNSRQAKIVEMRFLAGLTLEETAEALEVSVRTVSMDWRMAKAWLQRELNSEQG